MTIKKTDMGKLVQKEYEKIFEQAHKMIGDAILSNASQNIIGARCVFEAMPGVVFNKLKTAYKKAGWKVRVERSEGRFGELIQTIILS